jgi:3-methyladenine DNA glycosylase AlkD
MDSTSLRGDLKRLGTTKKAKASAWFFKTGPGEYGEGDVFFGVTVPEQRLVSKKYSDLPLSEIQKLLDDNVHECRLTALMILVSQYEKGDKKVKEKIVKFYLKNSKKVNNWDLVDSSAPYILGDYLRDKERSILYKFAESKNLWQRRISIVSTLFLIKFGEYEDTFKLCKILFKDKEDLIHKACGWALREVGKKSEKTLLNFLDINVTVMPRTTLRYSIERLSESKRKYYLNKK